MSKAYYVGFSRQDLTPKLDATVYLAGFYPDRKATGIRDPLFVRALAVRNANKTEGIAIAVLDLIGLQRQNVENIRKRLPEELASHAIIACTHTHSAPDTLGLWGKAVLRAVPIQSGVDDEYLTAVEEATARALVEAWNSAVEAELSLHKTVLPYPNLVENIRDPGNFDRTLSVLLAQSATTRAPIAAAVHFGCHPELLWEVNTQVSADFVGELCASLERELGCPVMFVNGALGGMVTPDISMEADLAERERFLRYFVKTLVSVAKRAIWSSGERLDGDLRLERLTVELPVENRRFLLMHKLGVLNREICDHAVETSVVVADLAGLMLVGLPGEPLPAVGYEAKARSGRFNTWVVGLADDELGYLLPSAYFSLRKYRYEQSMSIGANAVPTLMSALHMILRKF